MEGQVRQPDCSACPLNSQVKVWGQGPLDAEVLVVAEAPGKTEEEEGIPLCGWTGTFVNETLAYYGHPRPKVRVENVFQCKASYTSAAGRRAASLCGRTIWDCIRAMPNLRTVLAFGEAALRELSGYRAWEEAGRDYKIASKEYTRALAKRFKAEEAYAKKIEKWKARYEAKHLVFVGKQAEWLTKEAQAKLAGKAFKRKPPRIPPFAPEPKRPPVLSCGPSVPPAAPEAAPQGAKGISLYRGSPLWLRGYEGRIRLFPIIHPAAAAPKRKPQLRPLIMSDLRRATEFHSGKRVEAVPVIQRITDPETLRGHLQSLDGRVALDLEWSREANELVCIGLGTNMVGVLVLCDASGFRMPLADQQACFALLQEAFDNPGLSWGGHFVSGYDEHKLASVGLNVHCQWDSLYSFHILHADLGSAVDEDAAEYLGKKRGSAAGGYDLGFVTSVLTNMPYHKYMLEADALHMDPAALVEYCGRDVAACWWAQKAMDETASRTMPNGLFEAELQEEMELCRRAQKMSRRGVPINEGLRQLRLTHWESERTRIEAGARTLVGQTTFNLGSGPQLAAALESRGIRVRRNPETNNPMLDGNEVLKLLRKHPEEALLKLKQEYQRVETEIRAYGQIEPGWDGKAHISWKVHGTVGTRWSSTPNAQNLTREQREVIG